jgi:transcriptional regulator with XRE-family HTH domain
MATVITNNEAKLYIAANVKRLLAERRPEWSQSDLARATEDNVMTISHLIRGARLPSAALLRRVAEALGVSSDELMSPTADAFPKKFA